MPITLGVIPQLENATSHLFRLKPSTSMPIQQLINNQADIHI